MGELKTLFKKLDFIGHEIGFEDKGTTIFKTSHGAFFSSVTLIAIITISFMFGNEIYERKSPNMIYSSDVVNSSVIYMENFPALISFSWSNGTLVADYEKFVSPSIGVYIFNNQSQITYLTNYTFGSCSYSSFGPYGYLFSYMPTTGVICPKFDNNLYFSNGYTLPSSSFINFKFDSCNPATQKCDPNLDFYLKNFVISLTYINSYVDASSQSAPIKYYIDRLSEQVNNVFYKRNILSFPTNQFNSDNGWLLEDITTYSFISYDSMATEIIPISGQTALTMYAISFTSPTLRQKIDRSYMKVQELFAKVGGLANALFILIKLITFHYTRFKYILYLLTLSQEENSNSINIIQKPESNLTLIKKTSFSNLNQHEQYLNLKENIQINLTSKLEINKKDEDNIRSTIKDPNFKLDLDKNSRLKFHNNDENNNKVQGQGQSFGILNNISNDKAFAFGFADDGLFSSNNAKEQGNLVSSNNVNNGLIHFNNLSNKTAILSKKNDSNISYFDYIVSICCCNNSRKNIYKVMYETIGNRISLLTFSKITNRIL